MPYNNARKNGNVNDNGNDSIHGTRNGNHDYADVILTRTTAFLYDVASAATCACLQTGNCQYKSIQSSVDLQQLYRAVADRQQCHIQAVVC